MSIESGLTMMVPSIGVEGECELTDCVNGKRCVMRGATSIDIFRPIGRIVADEGDSGRLLFRCFCCEVPAEKGGTVDGSKKSE